MLLISHFMPDYVCLVAQKAKLFKKKKHKLHFFTSLPTPISQHFLFIKYIEITWLRTGTWS